MRRHSAWEWRPAKAAWYSRLQDGIASWTPHPSLSVDGSGLRQALADAVERGDDWLYHPCLNAITLEDADGRVQRDCQLAYWVAAHVPDCTGSIRFPRPLSLWSAAGSISVDEGTYALRSLIERSLTASWPYAITIDVWCHSIGFALPDSWAASRPDGKECLRLQSEVSKSIEIIDLAARKLDGCISWASDVTRVFIPLRSQGADFFRSGSNPNIAGLVFADQFGGFVQLMEALVHESAHLHLNVAEAEGPLVDPDHQGRYASPLRPEPRPLRGILLAYHAIAYICAFYDEVISAGMSEARTCLPELPRMQEKLAAAGEVLKQNSRHFTPAGLRFLERTAEVAAG